MEGSRTSALNIHGTERRRSEAFIRRVLYMSESLELNEIVAGAFVQEAQRKLPGFEDDEKANMQLAFQLYFEERRALLTALLELMTRQPTQE